MEPKITLERDTDFQKSQPVPPASKWKWLREVGYNVLKALGVIREQPKIHGDGGCFTGVAGSEQMKALTEQHRLEAERREFQEHRLRPTD